MKNRQRKKKKKEKQAKETLCQAYYPKRSILITYMELVLCIKAGVQ